MLNLRFIQMHEVPWHLQNLWWLPWLPAQTAVKGSPGRYLESRQENREWWELLNEVSAHKKVKTPIFLFLSQKLYISNILHFFMILRGNLYNYFILDKKYQTMPGYFPPSEYLSRRGLPKWKSKFPRNGNYLYTCIKSIVKTGLQIHSESEEQMTQSWLFPFIFIFLVLMFLTKQGKGSDINLILFLLWRQLKIHKEEGLRLNFRR